MAGGAVFLARPFIALVEPLPVLDSTPVTYADFESERHPGPEIAEADSVIDERQRLPIEKTVAVNYGNTLKDILQSFGIESAEASEAIDSLREVYDVRSLRAGQDVTVTFSHNPEGFGRGDLLSISLSPDPSRTITVNRDSSSQFTAQESRRQLSREIVHYSGAIRVSMFDSALNAGVPTTIIGQMIKALSYDVDFQRDVQAGDSFDVMFEGYYDNKGKLIRSGEMLYAAMTLAGKPIAMYRYEDQQGIVEYFNEKGESLKKALLRTPVDGAKITSGFGMRLHPLLGYTKMHKGVDFGVPVGTPIMAAGDGSVEKAGFNGAYGNYVRIRHSNGYGTAYAHMSRIAQGLYVGKHVTQGQIIGFVGATGRVTGPHLHYEILNGSAQVNPNSIKISTGTKLAGKDYDRFNDNKNKLSNLMARLTTPNQRVAAAPQSKPGTIPN
jgi:murein DD-endopeptidase MepM/ murein hydrolase activator NlpD